MEVLFEHVHILLRQNLSLTAHIIFLYAWQFWGLGVSSRSSINVKINLAWKKIQKVNLSVRAES